MGIPSFFEILKNNAMKVVINPKYSNLKGFIDGILSHSYKADNTYRNFRNIVEDTTVDGLHLVVKKFKKPTEANRVVYSFLRPSKAKRAYNYSNRLLQMGFDVPEPVAYMEVNKGLFFHTGYFLCLYTDYRAIADFRDNPEIDEEEMSLFLDEFSAYAADFHSKGLVHNDFNIDNILYKKLDGHYRFQLIDLNRMSFGNRSLMKCAKDMSSLHFSQTVLDQILERYCKNRNIDRDGFAKKVQYNIGKAKGRSKLKDIILTPLGLRKHKRAW